MMKLSLLFSLVVAGASSVLAAPLSSWSFFSPQAPKFMPYLQDLMLPSKSCLEPSWVIDQDALSTMAQRVKDIAARAGVYYDLTLDLNYSALAQRTASGRRSFVSSDNELWATWFLARSESGSQGVFMMMEADWGQGINFNERRESVRDTLGSLSNPQSALRGGNGVFIPHLSLGYSAWDGRFVVMAGTLDTSNFLDQDLYSDNWTGDLLNQAFNNNPCLPLTWANWGYMTAWQPNKHFYMMYTTTGSNGEVNANPFKSISANYWVHVAEVGFIFDDVMGLGAGTYRLQYTITREAGELGGGAALNFQQQLGCGPSLGFFSRVGLMDEDAASVTGVKAAATGGLVLMAPFSSAGWGSKVNNEQLALGFLWERAAASERPYVHKDEYGLELSAVVQLTPTMFIQPDVQYIFNPVHANGRDGAFVFQVQTTLRF